MGPNEPNPSYAVDIVFCIDCTGSMKPYLNSVKETARDFHRLLADAMTEHRKDIRQLRVRIVAFRDLGVEGSKAIVATDFFVLPDDTDALKRFVDGLQPEGGGDEPESALEALAVAMRSPWERRLDRRRHVIVMCTDASAHPLGKYSMPTDPQAPPLPRSLGELQAIWGEEPDDGEMEFPAKRLLLFAPDSMPWNEIGTSWEVCIWFPSAAGQGLAGSEQREILDQIAGSIR